nr:reverse transcriptase domain-containing protein [Tanacetum cinerariifolium]
MIKEHDQQAGMKATPRKLAYADSDKEALAGSLAKGFSDRFSLESSGTSDTCRQTRSTTKIQKTPSKNKEPTHLRRSRRLEDRSTTREKARRERSKSRRKRSGHQETSSDSEYEEGSNDVCKDLNSPYKRPKPTPFTQRITRFKYQKRAKLPRNIRVYEGNKDLKDHLEFSQQKRYAKDPTEIHDIRRRQNEGLQAFMDQFKSKSSHKKGVPSVLCISAFMHGHGHPKLAKKLTDKIPKMVDEMFERVRAFIGEKWPLGQQKWSVLLKRTKDVHPAWSEGPKRAKKQGRPKRSTKEYRGVHSLTQKRHFHPAYQDSERNPRHGKCNLPRATAFDRNSRKRNGNPVRNSVKVINMIRQEGNRKRSFEERRSGMLNELTFPEIHQSQLTDEPIILEGIIKGNQVQRILIDGGSSSEIMYEHCFRNLGVNIRSRLRRCRIPMIGFSGETYHPLGVIDLRVTLGNERRSKTVLMEFVIIKCRSPYNIIIGRTG